MERGSRIPVCVPGRRAGGVCFGNSEAARSLASAGAVNCRKRLTEMRGLNLPIEKQPRLGQRGVG